jgi:hypothetical protein
MTLTPEQQVAADVAPVGDPSPWATAGATSM